ncbi:MAG: stage V sporulation protein D [Armatimonadota bacterium]|nr:MAG: stage V sporulation protein D [Armatimonadota bacterium]
MAVRRQGRRFSLEDAQWRLLLTGWIVTLLFFGAWARLLYLQTAKADALRTQAQRYGGLRKRAWTVYGMRGAIKDRLGNVLAMDVMSLSIYIRPKAISDVEQTSRQLGAVLGTPASDIERQILRWKRLVETAEQKDSSTRRDETRKSVPRSFSLQRQLVGEKARRLKEAIARERQRLSEENEQLASSHAGADVRLTSWLDGVDVVEEPCRRYPYGAIASALIGFTSLDEKGLAGIEHLFEGTLGARHGRVEGVLGARGQIVAGTRTVRVPARNGNDVQLTIDANIQNIAEECLQEVMQKHQPAGACAVVMDVRTGDLLAVASMPRIDLNNWRQELKRYGLGVMRNMATTFLFEPGSTFKPITIAAAMQVGLVGDNSRFYCKGSLKIGRHTIHCARHGGSRAHGQQSLKEVVAHSCNIATAQVGMKLGAHALYEAVQRFGLLEKPVAGSLRGRLEKPGDWAKIRLANVAFGQGVQVTPLGLAAAYAAIANDGVYVKPRLLLNEPTETRVVLSPEVARHMREYLKAVVDEGTGKLADVRGYAVAGKTGTAQKVDPGRRGYASGKYVASFVGFAPADAPRIVVLVAVDEPRNGYFGGAVAAPAFARITERVLAYLGVPAMPDKQKHVSLSSR